MFLENVLILLHEFLLCCTYARYFSCCEGGGPTSILRKVFKSEYLENATYNFLYQTHCVACVRIASKTNEGFLEQNMTEEEDVEDALAAKLLLLLLLLSLLVFLLPFFFLAVVVITDAQ